MKYPTIEELRTVFQYPEKVLDILTSDIEEVIKNYPGAKHRVNECYNHPTDADIRLHAINYLEKFYGVDGVEVDFNDYISYLQAGDIYDLTLLYYKGRYWIGNWGDEAERLISLQ